jgi:hypothetical protein
MSKVKRQRATLTGIAAQRPDLRKPLHDGQKRLSGILGTLRGAESSTHTFGGGTVLMLRYRHRMSKDVDIFVPDPQYLGFVSPCLSDVAEAIASRYVEGPGYVKLLRSEGEIDFVASANLTNDPFEVWDLLGRQVRVETSAEIVAKKLWHRGERATARDLFDLALVIERDPLLLATASPFLKRHREPFLKQVQDRKGVLKVQFEAIDTLEDRPSYALAVELVSEFLWSLE